MTTRRFPITLALCFVASACVQSGWDEPADSISQAGVKGSTGVNGDAHFCIDPAFPCDSGEGDCDRSTECSTDLVCGVDNGPQFGFGSSTDVCVPAHCTNGIQDADETAPDCGGADCGPSCGDICTGLPAAPSRDHCSSICPCVAGDADCDGDSECQTGLVCGNDLGAQFGFTATVDVCVAPHCSNGVRDADEETIDCGGADCGTNCGAIGCDGLPANGSPGHCTTTCVCVLNHGDCDARDSLCAPGLICAEDVGADYGFGAGIDVCLPAHCDNGIVDGDEEDLDCGGSCPTCRYEVGVIGGAGQERVLDGAMDAAGNVVVVGRFNGRTDFGGTRVSSVAGSADIFVAKYTSGGALLWVRTFGSTLNDGDLDLAIAVGPSMEVAVTGNFDETIDFGAGPLTSNGNGDVFVLMLEANGSTRWARAFGNTGFDSGRGVVVRPNGEVAVGGNYEGSASFGGATFTSAGERDAFVARYRGSDGAHLASVSIGGTGRDAVFGVTANTNHVFIAGSFEGAVSFGSTMLTAVGQEDGFVGRLSGSTLSFNWVRGIGGSNGDLATKVAIDSSNRVYVSGHHKTTVDFGGGAITSAGGNDAYIAAYTNTGTFRWVRTFGGTGNDFGRNIACDPTANRVALIGTVEGTVANFPGGALPGFGGRDAYLVVYDTAGAVLSGRRDGGSLTDDGYGVAINSTGILYSGQFTGSASIANSTVVSSGGVDSFVTKLP